MRLTVAFVAFVAFAGTSAAIAVTGAGGSGGERAAGVTQHRVDLVWKPDDQDITGSGPVVLDTFDSFGAPFGTNRPVETRTPRSQVGTDQRSGKWSVFLTPGTNPGRCFGTFEVDRDVISTTATQQIVEFDGSARLRGCMGVRKFRDVEPGRLGKLTGRSVCRVGGCRGGLKIRGRIGY